MKENPFSRFLRLLSTLSAIIWGHITLMAASMDTGLPTMILTGSITIGCMYGAIYAEWDTPTNTTLQEKEEA